MSITIHSKDGNLQITLIDDKISMVMKDKVSSKVYSRKFSIQNRKQLLSAYKTAEGLFEALNDQKKFLIDWKKRRVCIQNGNSPGAYTYINLGQQIEIKNKNMDKLDEQLKHVNTEQITLNSKTKEMQVYYKSLIQKGQDIKRFLSKFEKYIEKEDKKEKQTENISRIKPQREVSQFTFSKTQKNYYIERENKYSISANFDQCQHFFELFQKYQTCLLQPSFIRNKKSQKVEIKILRFKQDHDFGVGICKRSDISASEGKQIKYYFNKNCSKVYPQSQQSQDENQTTCRKFTRNVRIQMQLISCNETCILIAKFRDIAKVYYTKEQFFRIDLKQGQSIQEYAFCVMLEEHGDQAIILQKN